MNTESMGSQIKNWWNAFPIFCKAIFATTVAVYILQCIEVVHFWFWCFKVDSIMRQYEVWRIVTCMFLHGGGLHILFNLLAFVSLGRSLECRFGTATMFSLSVVLRLISAAMELAAASAVRSLPATIPALDHFLARSFPYSACAIGLSGLIFTYIVIDVHMNDAVRSIFGFCSVPAKTYPWLLLVILQLLMPGLSLSGHLFGLLSGYAAMVLEPRLEGLRFDRWVPAAIKALPSYKTGSGSLTISGVLYNPNASSGGSWLQWPRFWSSSQSSFSGQGRVLGGGPAGPSPPAAPPTPPLQSQGYSSTASSSSPAKTTSGKFPGQGRTLGGGSGLV